MWLHLKAESKFTDRVHAVTVLPGCAAAVGLAEHGTLVAAVGRRLVAFSEPLTKDYVGHVGHMQKHHLIATAQPVTCLSPSPTIKGESSSIKQQESTSGMMERRSELQAEHSAAII